MADEDQPLEKEEREVIETAFEIIEQQLGGKIELIVSRNDNGSFAFMEPHHGTPDPARIMRKIARLVLFMSGE